MIVHTEPNFDELPREVASLFAAAGAHSFFSQAGWYQLIARHAREPEARVCLYTDSERPAAALVCCTDGERRLHSLSNFYSVEHAPVLRGADGAAALARLACDIAREDPSREAIRFSALDPAEPGFAALGAGLRSAGWLVTPYFEYGVWFDATPALDFERYLAARPGSLRNTWRRKAARARSNRLEFDFSGSTRDIESLIADYETIYRNSWKKSEPFPDFMPALMRWSFALGALRMGVVRIDGVPAAAQFWLLWQGRAVIYKLAHDERFDELSPGTLLTMRMFETVLSADRPQEINFGRGDDPYKKLWLPQRRERWGLVAFNPRTWRGAKSALRLVAGKVRDRLRRH